MIDFYFLDTNTRKKHWIRNLNVTDDEYTRQMCEDYACMRIRQLEHKYGVLDAEGQLTKRGWIEGYSSYEVEQHEIPELMEEFKKLFKEFGWI